MTSIDLKKSEFKHSSKFKKLEKKHPENVKALLSIKKIVTSKDSPTEAEYKKYYTLKDKVLKKIAMELDELNQHYKNKFQKTITRDIFASLKPKSFYEMRHILEMKYNDLLQNHCESSDKDNGISRDDINQIKKNDKINKKFFVTCISPLFKIHAKFLSSIKTFCNHNDATLVILPMNGVVQSDKYEVSDIELIEEYIATEYTFNNNLKALDIKLSPQQINPLTGLDRFGEKEYSLIIASPKQQMNSLTLIKNGLPHILHSTGMMCENVISYRSNRIGRIAEQDHILGGLIVDIKDSEVFFIRQVQADQTTGEFVDLNKLYGNNSVKKMNPKAIYCGDSHAGWEDENAIKSVLNQIEELEPEEIFLGDVFDGHSISHHHEKNIKEQVNRLESINTLEKELHVVANHIKIFTDRFPNLKINIIRSNHDEHLDRYLNEGRYIQDRFNHRLALQLAIYNLDGYNPIEKWLSIHYPEILKNVVFHSRESVYKIGEVQCSSHGDVSFNGIKASALTLEKAHTKCTVGHAHTAKILRNVYIVGTMSKFKLPYTKGPSSWTHTNCSIYENGSRQLLTSVNGEWKI